MILDVFKTMKSLFLTSSVTKWSFALAAVVFSYFGLPDAQRAYISNGIKDKFISYFNINEVSTFQRKKERFLPDFSNVDAETTYYFNKIVRFSEKRPFHKGPVLRWNKDIKIYLSDPKGSALFSYIKNGELKSEGGSITEGIGSSRVTKNFENAKIDDAYSIDDHEALPILYDLIENEGLSLGTSCGINIAGAIRMGKELGPGKTIVTILCDKSDKYATKMFNKSFLEEKGLPFPNWID